MTSGGSRGLALGAQGNPPLGPNYKNTAETVLNNNTKAFKDI